MADGIGYISRVHIDMFRCIVVPHVQIAFYFWLKVRALKRTLLCERTSRFSRFFLIFEMWLDFYLAFMSTTNCIAFLNSYFKLLVIS